MVPSVSITSFRIQSNWHDPFHGLTLAVAKSEAKVVADCVKEVKSDQSRRDHHLCVKRPERNEQPTTSIRSQSTGNRLLLPASPGINPHPDGVPFAAALNATIFHYFAPANPQPKQDRIGRNSGHLEPGFGFGFHEARAAADKKLEATPKHRRASPKHSARNRMLRELGVSEPARKL